jgi:hypothetical protein
MLVDTSDALTSSISPKPSTSASCRRASYSRPQITTLAHGPLKTDNSLKTVCLYLPSHVTENSAKKRSRYSARIEAVRDGAPTVVRYADGRLVFRKSEGNGFQSSTGLRSCMYPEIKTGAP